MNHIGISSVNGLPILNYIKYSESELNSRGNVGLYIDVPTYLQESGNTNFAIYIPHGHIAGFRHHIQRITGDYDISVLDTVILAIDTANVKLPLDAEDGQVYHLRKVKGKSLTISVNSDSEHTIYRGETNGVKTWTITSNAMITLIFDAVNSIWHGFYSNFN
jgi:hypothetical protein